MKKDGFTLVELMAVIGILVTIVTSSIFLLTNNLKRTKQTNLTMLLKEIELATDIYLSENESELINANAGNTICTKLYTLQNNSLIDKNLIDPTTDKQIEGTICVYSCLNTEGVIIHEIEGYKETSICEIE